MKFSVSWGNKENREIFNKTIFNNSEYQEKKDMKMFGFFLIVMLYVVLTLQHDNKFLNAQNC